MRWIRSLAGISMCRGNRALENQSQSDHLCSSVARAAQRRSQRIDVVDAKQLAGEAVVLLHCVAQLVSACCELTEDVAQTTLGALLRPTKVLSHSRRTVSASLHLSSL